MYNAITMIELEKLYNDKIQDEKFVTKFKKFISTNEFIGYSDIKDWIGYKQKRTIIEILLNPKFDYIEDIDYRIVKEKKEGVCKPVNEVYMTIDTIKCIFLTAPTELSQKFRKYYIEMEKIFKEYVIKNQLKNPMSCLEKYEFDINQWKKKNSIFNLY